jgi:hypothetical protein
MSQTTFNWSECSQCNSLHFLIIELQFARLCEIADAPSVQPFILRIYFLESPFKSR